MIVMQHLKAFHLFFLVVLVALFSVNKVAVTALLSPSSRISASCILNHPRKSNFCSRVAETTESTFNNVYAKSPRVKPIQRVHCFLSSGLWNDLRNKSSILFFPKRSTKLKSMIKHVSAFIFIVLSRCLLLGALPAWAITSSTSNTAAIPSPFPKAAITILRSLRRPRRIALTILAILILTTSIESVKANKRQKIDPTSEWGRYADKPSARGMALTFMLVKLIPYAIFPKLLERFQAIDFDEKNRTESSRVAMYEDSLAHRLRKRGGNMFADGLLRLGPLYIKIGQILSCRENLFPQEWISAMEKLQDRVPAKSGREAWELAYTACPGGQGSFHSIFSDFDDVPLAAASLGQVHKARLRLTGEPVAIKIQRARLRDIYDKDLALMKQISKFVDSFAGKAGQVGGVQQSWQDIFNDAETILYREIDYRDEADNAIRFANDFGLGFGGEAVESWAKDINGNTLPSANEWLRSPYTYKELSSEKFLVMEYVPSIKISSVKELTEAGVTIEDREYLAEALAHSYLRQFCVNKFFSTDPHPGNLGVEVFQDGRPPRLVFYDFGQACSLADDQAGGILEVIESIIDSDAKKSVSAFVRMGVLKDNADLDKVQAKCQSNYDSGKLKVRNRKKRMGAKYSRSPQQTFNADGSATFKLNTDESTMESSSSVTLKSPDVKDSEVMEYFTLQSEYAFVARALSQMDGVGKSLDPEFDFISAAAPYIIEVKGATKYLVDEAKKKLKFIYDKNDGILAKEVNFFKSLGFNPKMYDTAKSRSRAIN